MPRVDWHRARFNKDKPANALAAMGFHCQARLEPAPARFIAENRHGVRYEVIFETRPEDGHAFTDELVEIAQAVTDKAKEYVRSNNGIY